MAKVTSKLQLTLPKRLAEKHGIAPGDQIRFESAGGTITIVPGSAPAQTLLSREERLRLFDESTLRLEGHAPQEPASASTGRDWRREDLYSRGTPG